MGTRSLTVFEEEDGTEIAVMYRHMDGYPSGHGQDLAEFLTGFAVVNGLGGDMPKKTANGMGCLAAQIIAHFKDGAGGIYLNPAGTRDIGEEWVYAVGLAKAPDGPNYGDLGGIRLVVQAGCVTAFGQPGTKQKTMPTLFDGAPGDFDPEAVEKAYDDMERPPNDALEEAAAEQAET